MKKNNSLVLEAPILSKESVGGVFSAGMVRVDERIPKTEEELRLLNIRRKSERELIMKHDTSQLNLRRECWYLIDCDWLNAWSAFTATEEDDIDPPGPLSTKKLLDEKNNPLPKLQAKIDYRGVSPLIYFIFLELYGRERDGSPDICRYGIDIYMPPVPVADLVNMQKLAKLEAKAIVNKVRPDWIKWERIDDDDDDPASNTCCCGYVTKEHVEAFIYWAMRCWGSKKSARRGIKYSQYKPLKPDADTLLDSMSTHSNGSIEQREETGIAMSFAEKSYSTGSWLWNAVRGGN